MGPVGFRGGHFYFVSYVSETLEIYSESVRQVAENDIPSFYFGDSGIAPAVAIFALFSYVSETRSVKENTNLNSLDRLLEMTFLVCTLVDSLGDTMQMYWEAQCILGISG